MTKTSIHAFRVWDSGEGQYCSILDFITINRDGELMDWSKPSEGWGYTILNPERYTVERFTGFTDKNGRDIYEGDLIKWGKSFLTVKWVKRLTGSGLYLVDKYGGYMNMESVSREHEVVGTVHD